MTSWIAAEAGVRQLQARYVDAVWRKDYEAFGECFTEDAEWRVPAFADETGTTMVDQTLRGRAACVDYIREALAYYDRVLMTMRTPILELGSDGVATGRTLVNENNARKDRVPFMSVAIYLDRFVEQDGRWRFAEHVFQLQYMGAPDFSGQFFNT